MNTYNLIYHKVVYYLPLTTFLLFSFCFPIQASAQDLGLTKTKLKAKGVKVISNKIEVPIQTKTYEDNTPKEKSEIAREMFTEANKKFESRHLSKAIIGYQKAFSIWNHPRIIFNMGITLSMLSRPLDAAKMFRIVLEYGPDPVGPLRYKEAREKYIELMGILVVMQIGCKQSGFKIHIDGDEIGSCPFKKTVTLTSGRHLVTANKKGFESVNENVVLPQGLVVGKEITLIKLKMSGFKTIKRYSNKWHLGTAIASVVLMGVGSYMVYKGRSDIEALEDEITLLRSTSGTSAFDFDLSKQDKPVMYQNVGTGLFSFGSATAVSAAVLYFMQKKIVAADYEEKAETGKGSVSE
jgi:PEGA domain